MVIPFIHLSLAFFLIEGKYRNTKQGRIRAPGGRGGRGGSTPSNIGGGLKTFDWIFFQLGIWRSAIPFSGRSVVNSGSLWSEVGWGFLSPLLPSVRLRVPIEKIPGDNPPSPIHQKIVSLVPSGRPSPACLPIPHTYRGRKERIYISTLWRRVDIASNLTQHHPNIIVGGNSNVSIGVVIVAIVVNNFTAEMMIFKKYSVSNAPAPSLHFPSPHSHPTPDTD